jgi:hypothetical protein
MPPYLWFIRRIFPGTLLAPNPGTLSAGDSYGFALPLASMVSLRKSIFTRRTTEKIVCLIRTGGSQTQCCGPVRMKNAIGIMLLVVFAQDSGR